MQNLWHAYLLKYTKFWNVLVLFPITIGQGWSHSWLLSPLLAISVSQSPTPSQKGSPRDQEMTATLLTAGFQVSCTSSH